MIMFRVTPVLLPVALAMFAANVPCEATTMAARSPVAAASPAPAAAPASLASAVAPMTGKQVIQLLDQTIDWYRTLGIQQQAANEPSDLLILYDNRQMANQVIALAFDIARTNVEMLARQPGSNNAGDTSASSQSLAQLQNKFTAQGKAVQAELEQDQRRFRDPKSKNGIELQAKISELQGEMELIGARVNLLSTLISLGDQNESAGVSSSALKAQIDAMAVAVPSSVSASSAAASTPIAPIGSAATSGSSGSAQASTGVSATAAARFGIWDLAATVVKLSEKIATIGLIERRTADLQTSFGKIRVPLTDELKELSTKGDSLAVQADAANIAMLNQVREQLDVLSNEFKQSSALLIPLSKQDVLLNQYRRNLGNWHDSVTNQYRNALKTLGVRLGVLAVLLVIAFFAAELWRRAVLRYVQDSRRRYQLLLLRKIALWCLVVVIVGFAFASELGSIVTFAGLITAGLAVAMQSVLVSIVGYFFLIGKYGLRVGDRVQIGDVTGEVIELGLVRLYLMELGSHGSLGPTGRVVAFANSIVFQVSSGLFKQIHGVNFVWHEIVLTLPAAVDAGVAKRRLLAAVTDALKDYLDDILRQSKEIQRTAASGAVGDASPHVRLSFTATGVEAHVRYPVHLAHAAEIDERVSQELSSVISGLAPISGAHPA
jgi:small-conductance mechanosensitive channel